MDADAPPRRSLARTVALTTGTLTVARVVVIAAGIAAVALASRYLGLDEYGALVAAMAYASLFGVITDLGIATVAAREIARDPQREREILGNTLVLGFGAGAVAAAGGLALMFVAYPGEANATTRQGIAILLTQVVAAPVTSVARAHFTAAQRGHLIAAGDVALAVGMAGFTAIVVAAGGSYLAVATAVAGAYFAQAIVMGALALRTGGIAIAADRKVQRTLLGLTLPLAGALIVNFLYIRIDILLLSWLADARDVALYGLAFRVIEALMVLPSYVMLGLFPEIARHGDNPDRIRPLVGAALAGMEIVALPVVAVLVVFAPEIVTLIGGAEYDEAAIVLQLLAGCLALSFLNGVYQGALLALGRQVKLFHLTLVALGLNVAANLVLIPAYGVKGSAVAVLISELAAIVLVRHFYVQVAGHPPRPPHLRIALAGLALVLLVPLRLVLMDHVGDLVMVVIGGAVGLCGYGVLLVAFRALPDQLAALLPFPRRDPRPEPTSV